MNCSACLDKQNCVECENGYYLESNECKKCKNNFSKCLNAETGVECGVIINLIYNKLIYYK